MVTPTCLVLRVYDGGRALFVKACFCWFGGFTEGQGAVNGENSEIHLTTKCQRQAPLAAWILPLPPLGVKCSPGNMSVRGGKWLEPTFLPQDPAARSWCWRQDKGTQVLLPAAQQHFLSHAQGHSWPELACKKFLTLSYSFLTSFVCLFLPQMFPYS